MRQAIRGKMQKGSRKMHLSILLLPDGFAPVSEVITHEPNLFTLRHRGQSTFTLGDLYFTKDVHPLPLSRSALPYTVLLEELL